MLESPKSLSSIRVLVIISKHFRASLFPEVCKPFTRVPLQVCTIYLLSHIFCFLLFFVFESYTF